MNWRVSAESNCTLNWQINAEVLLIALMLVCPLADGPAQLALKNSFCAGCKYTSLSFSLRTCSLALRTYTKLLVAKYE